MKRARAFLVAALAAALAAAGAPAQQRRLSRRAVAPAPPSPAERAAAWVCSDRGDDPQGSTPIDVMQAQAAMGADDAPAVEGRRRAERLLPMARRLFPLVLGRLAAEYGVDAALLRGAGARAAAVVVVKPDAAARDNAAVRWSEPEAITFGTIFLAGLRSDEGMIAVLAHELTHAADGRARVLRPLFEQVRRRAERLTGRAVTEQQGAELTCELVGVLVAREYVNDTSKAEPGGRRLARPFGKNCAGRGRADDAHLAPRDAMVALLELEPALARAITGAAEVTGAGQTSYGRQR
jgi:hypothetical protein